VAPFLDLLEPRGACTGLAGFARANLFLSTVVAPGVWRSGKKLVG